MKNKNGTNVIPRNANYGCGYRIEDGTRRHFEAYKRAYDGCWMLKYHGDDAIYSTSVSQLRVADHFNAGHSDCVPAFVPAFYLSYEEAAGMEIENQWFTHGTVHHSVTFLVRNGCNTTDRNLSAFIMNDTDDDVTVNVQNPEEPSDTLAVLTVSAHARLYLYTHDTCHADAQTVSARVIRAINHLTTCVAVVEPAPAPAEECTETPCTEPAFVDLPDGFVDIEDAPSDEDILSNGISTATSDIADWLSASRADEPERPVYETDLLYETAVPGVRVYCLRLLKPYRGYNSDTIYGVYLSNATDTPVTIVFDEVNHTRIEDITVPANGTSDVYIVEFLVEDCICEALVNNAMYRVVSPLTEETDTPPSDTDPRIVCNENGVIVATCTDPDICATIHNTNLHAVTVNIFGDSDGDFSPFDLGANVYTAIPRTHDGEYELSLIESCGIGVTPAEYYHLNNLLTDFTHLRDRIKDAFTAPDAPLAPAPC